MTLVNVGHLRDRVNLARLSYEDDIVDAVGASNNSVQNSIESFLGSTVSATRFVDRYQAIGGANLTSGVGVLVFQDGLTGRYIASLDGTDLSGTSLEGFIDGIADVYIGVFGETGTAEIAVNQTKNWLTGFAQSNNIDLKSIDIVGHSKGAFVGAGVKRAFGDDIGVADLFAAPGRTGLIGDLIEVYDLVPGSNPFRPFFAQAGDSDITSYYLDGSYIPDLVTTAGAHYWNRYSLGESGPFPHSLGNYVETVEASLNQAIAEIALPLGLVNGAQSPTIIEQLANNDIFFDLTTQEVVLRTEINEVNYFVSKSGGTINGLATLSVEQALDVENVPFEILQAAAAHARFGPNDPGPVEGLPLEDRLEISWGDERHADVRCFPAGTPVLMADGNEQAIETVAIGDMVMAFDGFGELKPRRVTQTHVTPNQDLIQIGELQVTPGHEFLRADGSFGPVGALAGGGELVRADATLVDCPPIVPVPGKHTVFNFAVEDLHTYVAGGYRVHNTSLFYPVTDEGRIAGSLGTMLASGIYELYGGDNVAFSLIIGAAGNSLASTAVDAWVTNFDDISRNEVTFDPAHLVGRLSTTLPAAGFGFLLNQATGFITDPVDDFLDFDNPLAEQISDIAISTVANYAVTEIAIATLGTDAAAIPGLGVEVLVDPGGGVVTVGPDFATSLGGAVAGAIGSYIGSKLALLIVEPSKEASLGGAAGAFLGAKIGFNLGGPIGAGIGAFIGAFVGTIFGSFFGGGGGTVAAEQHTGLDVETGQFITTDGVGVIRGGNAELASTMANQAVEIMNAVVNATGGKAFYASGASWGQLNSQFLGGNGAHGSVEQAMREGIRLQVQTLKIEGGDRYLKHVIENYPGGEIEDLFADLGAAADYGAYRDNEALFIEALEAGDPLDLAEWQENLARALALGLENATEADDVYRDGYEGVAGTLDNTYGAVFYASVAAGADFTTESDATADAATNVLVLDLDGDGLDVTNASASSVLFDFDGDGFLEQSAWAGPGDGYLVIDADKSGRIEDVSEMVVSFGAVAEGDLGLGLADFDSNDDGVVDLNDDAWEDLRVWVDANQNGQTDFNELLAVHRFGITGFSTVAEDADGAVGANEIMERGKFVQVGFDNDYLGGIYNVALGHADKGIALRPDLGEATRGINVSAFELEDRGNVVFADSSAAVDIDVDPTAAAFYVGGGGNDTFDGSNTDARETGDGSIGGLLLNGEGGHDTLLGGAGNDWLIGGEGSDALKGGAGDDVLVVDVDDLTNGYVDGGADFDVVMIEDKGDAAVGVTLDAAGH